MRGNGFRERRCKDWNVSATVPKEFERKCSSQRETGQNLKGHKRSGKTATSLHWDTGAWIYVQIIDKAIYIVSLLTNEGRLKKKNIYEKKRVGIYRTKGDKL